MQITRWSSPNRNEIAVEPGARLCRRTWRKGSAFPVVIDESRLRLERRHSRKINKKQRAGKPEAYRLVLRQSRLIVQRN